MREIRTKVVGVTYDNEDGSSRQAYIDRLQAGDTLILERDPNNKSDPNAIKVIFRWKGWFSQRWGQIGHLNRLVAEAVSYHIQNGGFAYGTVNSVTGGSSNKPTAGVNITVHLIDA